MHSHPLRSLLFLALVTSACSGDTVSGGAAGDGAPASEPDAGFDAGATADSAGPLDVAGAQDGHGKPDALVPDDAVDVGAMDASDDDAADGGPADASGDADDAGSIDASDGDADDVGATDASDADDDGGSVDASDGDAATAGCLTLDCDDANPCTEDSCTDGACVHLPATGASCDDGDVCTEGSACTDQGLCSGGSPVSCDDGKPCTVDSCEAYSGCVHESAPLEGSGCDDGSACTHSEACVGGSCFGKALDCGDQNPCTSDTCDLALGCVHTSLVAPCNDGDSCTVDDACTGGTCQGAPKSCDDQDPCTDDACTAEGCAHTPATGTCDDGDACTVGDACVGGVCSGEAALCDDKNPCTTDSCAPASGCVTAPATGPCDDLDPCTTDDACDAGACVGGAPAACDDGDACTADSCDPASGCTHPAVACDDGVACTADSCDPATGCAHVGADAACDDGVACTTDACDAATGCTHAPESAACDDAIACTTDGCAAEAGCTHSPEHAACNDGIECTTDACDTEMGCSHTVEHASCNDGNVCTSDACSGVVGCTHEPKAGPCDDGDACTAPDLCDGGACAGAAISCDDDNPCTIDSCDPSAGCAHAPASAACEDGDPCTVGDTCNGGACQPGEDTCECRAAEDCAPQEDGDLCNGTLTCDTTALPYACVVDAATIVSCEAPSDCQVSACEPVTGACIPGPVDDGALCDDGDACTSADTCAAGACGGSPKTCDDGNPCTDDACDPATGECTAPPGPVGKSCGPSLACVDGVCLQQGCARLHQNAETLGATVEVEWVTELCESISAPSASAIATSPTAGRSFLMRSYLVDGGPADLFELVALDAETGGVLWRESHGSTQGPAYGQPGATPVATPEGDVIYTYGGFYKSGQLVRRQGSTGSLVWEKTVGTNCVSFQEPGCFGGLSNWFAVTADAVYVGLAWGAVGARNALTGDPLWTFTQAAGFAYPGDISVRPDGRVVAGSNANTLFVLGTNGALQHKLPAYASFHHVLLPDGSVVTKDMEPSTSAANGDTVLRFDIDGCPPFAGTATTCTADSPPLDLGIKTKSPNVRMLWADGRTFFGGARDEGKSVGALFAIDEAGLTWASGYAASTFLDAVLLDDGTGFVLVHDELFRVSLETGETLWASGKLKTGLDGLSVTPSGALLVAMGSGVVALRFPEPLVIAKGAWATIRGNLEHSGQPTP